MKHTVKKLYIIDGNAYIHRAYHALPKTLTAYSGLPINAVYGFIRMIFKILKIYKPEYLCICLDSEKPTFRHKMFKEYKATRKELEDDIKIQFPIVYEFIKESGIPYIRLDGYEADDLISYLVKKFKDDYEIVIISGDKDILQLVENNKVVVYNEHKDIFYNEEKVIQKYQVPPKLLVDYFSLIGDKTDNIEGIEGIGPKTASLLINKFGPIEEIFRNIHKLELKLKEKFVNKQELLLKNKDLLKLNSDINELENFSVENIKFYNLKIDNVKKFILKYNMRSLLNELEKISSRSSQNEEKNYFLFETSTENINTEISSQEEIIYIDTEEKFNKIIKKIKETEEIVFSCIYNKKDVVGIVGMLSKFFYFYIPFLKHKSLKGNFIYPLSKEYITQIVNFLFFDLENIRITFDVKSQLKLLDVDFKSNISKNIYDIFLLSYLLNPDKKLKTLQEIVDVYLPTQPVAEFLLPQEIDVSFFSIENLVNRFINSLNVLNSLFDKLKTKLNEYSLFNIYKDIDLPVIIPLIKMEKNGILVDKEYAENYKTEVEEKIKQLKNEIYKIAGLEFNLNSPKQLSFVLFEKLKLPPVKKKKTGYSTDEEVLQKLYNVHTIIPLILQYRELEKLKNTYIIPLLNYINPNTHRIHTLFNLTGTATGRLSSEDPNMQNLPVKTELGKKIRKMFIAEKEFKLVSLDYSQIELRILAHFSEDKNLITSFFENKDIHKSTACEIFGVKEEEVNDEFRRIAKVINFGIIYGITPQGLAKELSVPIETAESYIKKYFEKYSQVKEWISTTISLAKKTGYVKTLFGRIRFIPEINSSNKQLASFGERLAVNTPIQGTAADIIKLAMIKINEFISINNIEDKVRMLLQIHDA
ncbi:MAG: DNA polymerase I [Endomicrobia bacterium]|nr:DNA polymerase I [Endomicrobiia bacterium]